eukprot:symbB.v1.2.035630.t1/scaffold4752.1/size35433/1
MTSAFSPDDDASVVDEKGMKVHFSDDRFLHRVLVEAQKNGTDASSLERLQWMGFGPEIAKVALHVSAGDERKALELCMSGLSFVDDTVLERRAPPAPLRCYICGQKYLNHTSLDMHLKACRRRFSQREAHKPEAERCPLLEEDELPDGVKSLEQHYDLIRSTCPTLKTASDSELRCGVVVSTTTTYPSKLIPCEFCKRTFHPDRLDTHQRVCLHRPKPEPKRPPRRRVTLAGPPAAAIDSYATFCSQLERCSYCSRQFRREVLQSHEQSCGSAAQPRTVRRAATSPMTRSRQRSTSSQGLAFTPPSRKDGHRTPSVRGGFKWTPGPTNSPPSPSQTSVTHLREAGLICNASEEDEMRLTGALLERLPDLQVLGVFETIGPTQRSVYDALKLSMSSERGGEEVEELDLWHGTSWAFLPKILKQGFNRSFAGRHGTLLGHATYFSSDCRYSLRFCDKKGGGQDGTQVLVAARVLVGRYCKGSASDVEPPVFNEKSGDRYDTTVDNAETPSIFAVFRDFQALPLFIIEIRV